MLRQAHFKLFTLTDGPHLTKMKTRFRIGCIRKDVKTNSTDFTAFWFVIPRQTFGNIPPTLTLVEEVKIEQNGSDRSCKRRIFKSSNPVNRGYANIHW